jgi:hypothetical protein
MFINLLKKIINNIYNFFIYLSCRIKSSKSDDESREDQNIEENDNIEDIEKNNLIESEQYNITSPIIRLRRGSIHCDDIKVSQKKDYNHPICEIIIRD